MDIATVLYIVGLLLRISVAVPTHSWDESDLSTASVVVKEGESAEISCMLKESNVAYFWLKGGSLENSTVVASFISGITINDPDDPFTVTENGTLIIKKVSRNDEGNYICRVSSEEISCHGDVFVFVQAALQDFQLTIEYCEPENSCVISTESTKPTSLTCKATNASPSMKLKWFNGSHEIKDNIEENSLTKEASKEISSTIRDVYKAPSTLTCQAVDFKRSNDDGMFAHVQFRTPAATTDISPGWIVTAILFIVGFVILFIIVIFITVWRKVRNGKDVETQNSTELESLLKSNNERLEANLQTKDDEITKLITDLKTKDNDIKKKVEEITKLNTELMGTKAEKRVDESNVTSKDEELQNKRKHILKLEEASQSKDKQIQSKNEEIAKLKLEVQGKDYNLETKDKEITKLKEASQSKEDQIKTKNEEITTLREASQSKDDQIKTKNEEIAKLNEIVIKADANKEVKDVTLEAKTKEHTREIQLRDQNIANMKIKAQRNEQELNKYKQGIASLNAKVQEQDKAIQLKDQRINRMKDLDKKAHEIESQHKTALTKEQEMKNEENKIKDSYRKLEISKRDFRAMKMAELETTTRFCGIVRLKGSKVLSVQMDGKDSSITYHDKTLKFSHIFNIGANVRETFERMSDFVENAIDGGQSCVIAFGNSKRHDQMKTMYAEHGIIPLSFQKILERSIELKRITYTVNVKAKFVHTLGEKEREIFICKGIKGIADKCVEPTDVKSIDVNDEKTMGQLLNNHLESQQETQTAHDCFVQFIINTTTDGAKVAPRTGKITFATLFGIEMIKKCFSPEPTGSKLAQYISKIIRDPNSKSLLLVHLNEDRDDVREILKVTGQITEFTKKKSVFRSPFSGK